ncbi:MAG: sugar-binding protein [Deltaproteobacteria bacterium]|nr:sugar-binding protein [Deltaproteobacteria bacterium]
MPVIPTGWTGLVPQPASSTARFAAGWTSTGLYFYAEIDTTERVASTNDASLHCGDSLEIFVDDNGTFLNPPAYDARGTRQFVIAAPNGNESTSKRAATWLLGQSGGLWTGQYTSLSSATGFTVEALVDARDLGIDAWALQSGGLVGIDLAVNVGGGSDPSCPRLGQYAFRTAAIPAFPAVAPEGCVAPWCNTDAFCKPELRPRSPSR